MKKLCIVFISSLISCVAFSQTTYTFSGNGNWSNASNWTNNTKPPARLPSGSSIFISPQAGDSCVLNTPHKNLPGSNMVITTGAKFIVRGGIGDYSDSADLVTRLKKVTYPIQGSNFARGGEPAFYFKETAYYFYDSLNRLKERKLVANKYVDYNEIIDTSNIFNYYYSGNSPQIIRYTDRRGNLTLNHSLTYDLQNRLIKDSSNDLLGLYPSLTTTLTYLYQLDTIFKYKTQANPQGNFADTLIMVGNNVVNEKIKSGDLYIQNNFIVTAYRNPYSYANNFTLFGSDYKPNSSYLLENLTSDNNHIITYNQCIDNFVIKTILNTPHIAYNSHYSVTQDSFGRIKTISKSSDYSTQSILFEYY